MDILNNPALTKLNSVLPAKSHYVNELIPCVKFDERNDEKELELWTGLCDNNGKKIYEGDIISIYASGDFINYTVVYNKDRASFVAIVDDYEKDFTCYSDIEVIGNIHENKEILKK
ncbi:hypothetical protein AJY72_00165 [Campylobacter jejuni]|uniref:YopX family protein n=1 Tax=Campylobacter TaxID=194 RepID=UPI000698F94A|nr:MULTISPECIES: YopX family protein [Campylobacter]ECK7568717.1 hypothetical protein [Campylobacter coli]ECK7755281.1 hypothetical protein [Campylobacter coli]ECK8028552.1 hypothetical protein [Campylobacter coli]ECK8515983.1 hypothetical protein [Campylobacter coli]ECL1844620.1 hypothetical protein [Campylobacter coli]